MSERVSILIDGEADEHEGAAICAGIALDIAERRRWREYALISDAMQGRRSFSAGFCERFAERLRTEPTVLAPQSRSGTDSPPARLWRNLSALAAGLAGVAVVGWLAFTTPPVSELARSPAPVTVTAPAQVPPPPAASDYVMVHQAFLPRGSLVRIAEERPAR